jgi:hypothetical protein
MQLLRSNAAMISCFFIVQIVRVMIILCTPNFALFC